MSDLFRPERMSKVSVTGAKSVMDEVVEAVHDLHLLHVTDYDESWEGFSPGDPVEGADEVSGKLVTVRSLESILDVDEDDAGRTHLVTDEAIETELEEIRQRVNELNDRRDELEDELRTVEEHLGALTPFAELGIDLDLLSGYDTLAVTVGEGDPEAVRGALAADEAIDEFELFTGDGVVAVFARPAEGAGEDVLQDALVGVEFGELSIPGLEGGPVDVDADRPTPETYVEALEERRDQLESRLATVEDELEDEKLEAAGFLLAVEETLSIEAQKREAPLSFATTENAFVAEGWIPTDRYDEFEETVAAAVDGHVEIEELERADYDEDGHPEESEEVEEAISDGGTTMADSPPVIQDNPGPAKPFEVLVQTVARPLYGEFDPTVILWLTFPAFFGFMIGDVGYGVLYMAIGYAMWSRFDNDAIRALGGVGLWAGFFTLVFGVLYGELFGLHQLGEIVWGGNPPMSKGLMPAESHWAIGWIIVTVLVGILHVTLGYTFSFVQDLRHGVADAVLESGSWALMMWGLWGWIFSEHMGEAKPSIIYGADSVFYGEPIPLGLLPAEIGLLGLGAFVLGLVLVGLAEPVEFIEALFLQVVVRALSYTRIAAVLLAKAGMAFVVNLLVFGAYAEHTESGDAFHFLYFSDNTVQSIAADSHYSLIFAGVVNGEGAVAVAVGWLAGLLIFVVGHLVVLGLGITSAGLQGVRLEYVEFFSEFYEGGGDPYEPFGYDRKFTTED